MTNRQILKRNKQIRRNRRRIEKLGNWCMVIGFCIVIGISGDYSPLTFGQLFWVGMGGCALMLLGLFLTQFITYLNEEYPLNYNLVAEGDDLWYSMYINETKKWRV